MTQAEWFERVKSWVPDWMFGQSQNVAPILQGLAKLMADHETEQAALLAETFIDASDGSWVDVHGHERNITRIPGELDPPYKIRVRTQNLVSKCDVPDLKSIVDKLVIRGQCSIREDGDGGLFFNRGIYMNRAAVSFPIIKDTFTVVVDRQVHAPYAFLDRGAFANRYDFVGQSASNQAVFQLIIQAVNDNRAFGALFRIVERLN